MALPWDSLFLAGFVYSGYRTLGRWLKYSDDNAKAQSGARACQLPGAAAWQAQAPPEAAAAAAVIRTRLGAQPAAE